MSIKVSLLNQKELRVHDLFIELISAMSKLDPRSQQKVYDRWIMLKLLTPQGIDQFKENLVRVNSPIDNPTQVTISEGGITLD